MIGDGYIDKRFTGVLAHTLTLVHFVFSNSQFSCRNIDSEVDPPG